MYALRKTLTRGLFVLTVLSLLIAALPAAVTAQGDDNLIARLPPPSGEYVVGRTAYQWTDEAREEVHTEDPDDQRELLVEVWYPAAPEPDAEIGNYLELPMAMHYARMVNQESSVADVLAMQANAYPDAPLSNAQDTYPVVLFDPGFSVLPRRYTLLLEGIASHGYIVFAVSHPYVTSLTVMPDGRLIEPLDYNRLSSLWAPQDVYDGEYEGAWLPDMLFVLEQLDAIHADDPAGRFTGRLDLDGFGMIGHSQGSRVVSEVCLMDTRCAGAISLDGRRSPLVDLTMDRPYMAIMADNGVSQFVNEFEHGMESLGAGYYVMMILQTNHMSFVDDAYWLPLALGAPAGEIPVELALGQLALYDYRAYMVAFLDKHIRARRCRCWTGRRRSSRKCFSSPAKSRSRCPPPKPTPSP
jgi:predicted dienelactone hydrolase